MEQENDSTTVSTETTEEKGAETTEQKEGSNDLAEIKTMLEQFNGDIGSLKRTVKSLSKTSGKSETPESNQELSSLQERLDKQTFRAAGITHEEDIKLAQETAKKWNMSIDDIIDDEDFVAKLDKQRTHRSNLEATTDIKGNKGGDGSSAKHKAEFWLAKGVPPTPSDIPDKKVRTGIIREMMKSAKVTKKFYND